VSKIICPICGKPTATASVPEIYHYKESGLPNVYLHGGVTETTCESCGEGAIRIEREGQLLQVITTAILMSDSAGMTGAEMRFVRGACRMSQAKLAESLGIQRRETIAEREGKDDPGISFAEQIGLRVLLTKSFLDFLDVPGNRLLTMGQHEELREFYRNFSKFSEHVSKEAATIQFNAILEEDEWKFDKAA
jgi:DNA-binding XRE family transcriptional regulator